MSDAKKTIAFVIEAKRSFGQARFGETYTFAANEWGTYRERKNKGDRSWTSLRVDVPTKERLDALRAQLHTLLNDVQEDGGAKAPEYLRELSMVQLLEILSQAALRVLEPASGKAIADALRAAGQSDDEIRKARSSGNVHAVRRSRRKVHAPSDRTPTRRKSA